MEKLYEEINFDEITYIKYLNKLIVINPSIRELKRDGYYLLKDEKTKRQVVLQYKYTYPSKVDLSKFTTEKGVEVFKHSVLFIFSIVKDFPIGEEITRYKIVLNGFSDVIDDRNYVYNIPLVNEIFHNDNYIISNTNTRVCFRKGDTIDNFIVNYETFRSPCVEVMGYYDKHHKDK